MTRRLTAWMRPSIIGMIVFVLLIALQACLGAASGGGRTGPGGSYEITSSRSMGWPASVVVTRTTTGDGPTRTAVKVRWERLLPAVAITYGIAMAAGHLAMRKRRRRHPAIVFSTVIAGTLFLAFVAAAGVSKSLWGYYLFRPPLDRRLVTARKVRSVTIVMTTHGAGGGPTLVPDTGCSIAKSIEYARKNPYYSLGERALVALEDAKRLPPSPPRISADRLGRLFDVLARTGRIEEGDPGYGHAKDLRGIVIEAEGADGTPLLFVGVQGGEVSNDHHPYYEFLFSGHDPGGGMRLLSAHRFYYDVAGIEGLEWPWFFLGFSALGLVFSVPTTLLVLAVWPAWSDGRTKPD